MFLPPRCDGKSCLEDKFERLDTGIAVVNFLFFGQFLVGNKAGVFFVGIISFRAIGPALRDAGLRPYIAAQYVSPKRHVR